MQCACGRTIAPDPPEVDAVGGATAGTLIFTEDDANGGISSAAIHKLSEEIF
jgi:hypothetical protein